MDVSAAGQAFLLAALACALGSAGTSAAGVKRNDNRLAASGERSLFATWFFIICATIPLVYGFFARGARAHRGTALLATPRVWLR